MGRGSFVGSLKQNLYLFTGYFLVRECPDAVTVLYGFVSQVSFDFYSRAEAALDEFQLLT